MDSARDSLWIGGASLNRGGERKRGGEAGEVSEQRERRSIKRDGELNLSREGGEGTRLFGVGRGCEVGEDLVVHGSSSVACSA